MPDSMDDCPVEFREKVVVSPLRLIGATFLLTAVVSFVMILPLAFLAKTNKYIPGFAIYLIFSFAIFFFLKELGINVFFAFKKAIDDRVGTFKVFAKYFFMFMGFLFLLTLIIFGFSLFFDKSKFPGLPDSVGFLKPDPAPIKNFLDSQTGYFSLAVFFLKSCLLAPFVEEAYFRRLFYVSLRKKNNFVFSLLITSLFFAVLHPNTVSALIGGVYLTYMYEKERNIMANMLVHSAANFVIILTFLFF